MSDQGDIGLGAPLGGGGGDDLGDIKIKRGGGVLIPIIFIIGLIGVGAAAVWYFAMREDPSLAHEAFRREILGPTQTQYYDEFWACALNEPLGNFKSNTELQAKIQQNIGGGDAKRYASHLIENEKCLPLLGTGLSEFEAMKTNKATPVEYGPYLDKLSESLGQVKRTWTEFAQFELQADDRAELRDRIKLRGESWVGYQSSVRDRVPEKIAHYTENAVTYYRFLKCVLGDRDMTSFTGAEGQSAQDQMLAVLDQQCAQNRAAFLSKLQGPCKSQLWPEGVPEADDDFQGAIKHWSTHDNDFGSAVPMIECLEEYDADHAKTLISNIAKAWYDYSKTYRELIDYSKSKSGGLPGSP